MNKASTANAYLMLWDNPIPLTLIPKAFASTTTDAAGASVTMPACRKHEPMREKNEIGVVVEHCQFEIWDVGQTAFPLPGDTLQDQSDSSKWIIDSVEKEVFENDHVCDTTRFAGS